MMSIEPNKHPMIVRDDFTHYTLIHFIISRMSDAAEATFEKCLANIQRRKSDDGGEFNEGIVGKLYPRRNI